MSVFDDEENARVDYYKALGYGESQAKTLGYADITKQRADKAAAAEALKTGASQAEEANKSFIDSLTSKLTELVTGSAQKQQEQTDRSVQAIIDTAAGNSALDTAAKAFQHSPDDKQGGVTLPPINSAKSAGGIGLAIVAAFAIFYFVRKRK